MKAAIIDIGSNSIRYMAGETKNGRILPGAEKLLYTTRLAAGLDQSGLLSFESMEKSIAVLKDLVSHAKETGLPYYAYATSAVRSADNREEFLARVREACSLHIHVIEGELEGELARLGAGGDLMDIGGGSAQLSTREKSISYPAGCVRGRDLLERQAPSGTPEEQYRTVSEWLERIIGESAIAPEAFPKKNRWAGAGGTITTLAALSLGLTAYDRDRVHGTPLTREGVWALIEKLHAMGGARKEHPLLTKRHDVILPGAYILMYLLGRLKEPALFATDADGMEGYLLYTASKEGEA